MAGPQFLLARGPRRRGASLGMGPPGTRYSTCPVPPSPTRPPTPAVLRVMPA
ncbi:hypothetical protein [Actinophytocola glycyrrhizae]|uniref:Uncharacterized protein n=1 Tax=Actinophytocola glycyrrhizae TaxID=2044873 RepID=A0ABV9S935_9PSEU